MISDWYLGSLVWWAEELLLAVEQDYEVYRVDPPASPLAKPLRAGRRVGRHRRVVYVYGDVRIGWTAASRHRRWRSHCGLVLD